MSSELFSSEGRQDANAFGERAVGELYATLTSARPLIVERHGMAWRVKTEPAIRAKLARGQPINDFIGIRVLATHVGLINPIMAALEGWETALGLRRVRADTDYDNRDESGFHSVHFDYEVAEPVRAALPAGMTVELQVTTWLQHLHGFLSHQLYYKAVGNRSLVAPGLRRLSRRLERLDEDISKMMSVIDSE